MGFVTTMIGKRPTTKPKSLQPAKKKTLGKMSNTYKVMVALEKRVGLVSQKTLSENARVLIKCIASIHVNLPSIAARKYENMEEFSDIDDIVKALQRIFVDRWSLCENIEEQVTRKIKNTAVLLEMGMKRDDTVDTIARRLEKLCTKIMQVPDQSFSRTHSSTNFAVVSAISRLSSSCGFGSIPSGRRIMVRATAGSNAASLEPSPNRG